MSEKPFVRPTVPLDPMTTDFFSHAEVVLQAAAIDALRGHALAGRKVVVADVDGNPVWIQAEQLLAAKEHGSE